MEKCAEKPESDIHNSEIWLKTLKILLEPLRPYNED